MNSNKGIVVGGLVVLALIVCAFVFFRGSVPFGAVNPTGPQHYQMEAFMQGLAAGTANQSYFDNTGKFRLGATGTLLTRTNSGQCYFAPSAATIVASTTISIDCQATAGVGASAESALVGVTSGDNVFVQLSTTTAQTSATQVGLVVVGASASTTAGYITVRLSNLNGTTFTWPLTGTASGTASYIVTK